MVFLRHVCLLWRAFFSGRMNIGDERREPATNESCRGELAKPFDAIVLDEDVDVILSPMTVDDRHVMSTIFEVPRYLWDHVGVVIFAFSIATTMVSLSASMALHLLDVAIGDLCGTHGQLLPH